MRPESHSLAHITLILHDIRSVVNVGAMFRTAEAFGVGEIILSGYTPGPLDRFGRVRSDFQKSALGASESVSWRRLGGADEVLESIEDRRCELLVLEQDKQSIDIREFKGSDYKNKKLALVVGNEVDGVEREFVNNAAAILEIPMFGKKESFNVASATAIALYAFLSQ